MQNENAFLRRFTSTSISVFQCEKTIGSRSRVIASGDCYPMGFLHDSLTKEPSVRGQRITFLSKSIANRKVELPRAFAVYGIEFSPVQYADWAYRCDVPQADADGTAELVCGIMVN